MRPSYMGLNSNRRSFYIMAIECKMYYPNEERRQFHENSHLPARDICALNRMGLVLGLVFAHRFIKIECPNEEFPVIFSIAF